MIRPWVILESSRRVSGLHRHRSAHWGKSAGEASGVRCGSPPRESRPSCYLFVLDRSKSDSPGDSSWRRRCSHALNPEVSGVLGTIITKFCIRNRLSDEHVHSLNSRLGGGASFQFIYIDRNDDRNHDERRDDGVDRGAVASGSFATRDRPRRAGPTMHYRGRK